MFYIGLDLGQTSDYTALAVLEQLENRTGAEVEYYYHGRHLQRFALGTTYPAIVAQVKALVENPAMGGEYALAVDQTGVGRPVVDLLREAGLSITAVTVTAGNAVVRDGFNYHVPKRDLITCVQVILQSGRLKFAESLHEVPTLINEFLSFQVKISEAGKDSYGAWREGTHDDLLFAVALAAWYGESGYGWWMS